VTTIETHQVVIVRRTPGATLAECPACLNNVKMVPLEQAALLSGVSLRDICRRVGDGDIHFVEAADGGLVCLPSLLNEVSFGDGGLNCDGGDTRCLLPADTSDAATPPPSPPYE